MKWERHFCVFPPKHCDVKNLSFAVYNWLVEFSSQNQLFVFFLNKTQNFRDPAQRYMQVMSCTASHKALPFLLEHQSVRELNLRVRVLQSKHTLCEMTIRIYWADLCQPDAEILNQLINYILIRMLRTLEYWIAIDCWFSKRWKITKPLKIIKYMYYKAFLKWWMKIKKNLV